MNCPNCQAKEDKLYRKDPKSLTVWCELCGITFTAKQALEPLLTKEFYKSKGLKGIYRITVWHCPIDVNYYSFAYCYGNSLPVKFDQFPGEFDWMCGKYKSPQEALEGGIREVYERG